VQLLLIDDEGGTWDGGSLRVRQAFNSPYSGGEFVDYVVKNLGFVAIDTYGQFRQIRLRPSRTSERALAALIEIIGRQVKTRYALTWFDQDWRYALVSQSDLVWRLEQLLKGRRNDVPEAFVVQPLVQGDIAADDNWNALLEASEMQLDSTAQVELLKQVHRMMNDRFVVVKGVPEMQKLVFETIGDGMFRSHLPWVNRPIGEPIDQQPDENYGRWIHNSYEAAMRTGKPVFQKIDAIIDWRGHGRKRLRYRRMLFPYRTEQGEPRVLGASLMDDRIDLRLGPKHKVS
jgi:hypothetical protein